MPLRLNRGPSAGEYACLRATAVGIVFLFKVLVDKRSVGSVYETLGHAIFCYSFLLFPSLFLPKQRGKASRLNEVALSSTCEASSSTPHQMKPKEVIIM